MQFIRALGSVSARFMTESNPIRFILKIIIKKLSLGSYRFRLAIGAVERPNYGHIVFNAASLAHKLGLKQVSVLEYGVAKGSGLLNLEYHANEIEKIIPIKIQIYGFDTGKGLPKPMDYRDLPYHWEEGFFEMNQTDLIKKLSRSRLILGNIMETRKSFFQTYSPAPIGAIVHDLDYYSSTKAALEMLHENTDYYLPRVFCYFDDTIGTPIELYSDFTGERLAIDEFNNSSQDIKITKPYYFLTSQNQPSWHSQVWIIHFFKHALYDRFVSIRS